jgi:hypothetical protein
MVVGFVIKDLPFAYDIDWLTEEESLLQIRLSEVYKAGEDLEVRTGCKHG